MAFSPDGKWVVSGSLNGPARVWEAATGRVLANMTSDLIITTVAFSPDGKWVVSGSLNGPARVWEATTGREVSRMTHDKYVPSGFFIPFVTSVAFSPDSKWVVSGSNDGTARVWEADTRRELVSVIHAEGVTSVAFSPDGKWVVSGSEDDTARVWLWQPKDFIAETCRRLPRNLTLAEWQQYFGIETPYHITCNPEIYPNAIIPEDAKAYLDGQ
jgi:WD40 repeat protein